MRRSRPNGFGGLLLALSLGALFVVSASACAGNMNGVTVPTTPNNDYDTQSPSVEPAPPPPVESSYSSIELHQDRYPLKDTNVKLVDNRGNGYEALYGTRNVRAVLNGVMYRGGANNAYNKYGTRANSNPLPTLGLTNLCKEGFANAVYLYTTNYSTAPKSLDCASNLSALGGPAKNHIDYKQLNASTASGIKAIFDLVYASIKDPARGPVYVHCWNGWHASGLSAALALRQFCGFSAAAAEAYWQLNTDGTAIDSQYTNIRERIRTFVPLSGYTISAEMKKEICPN